MKTKAFKTESGTVNLRRPTFREMRDLGGRIEKLLEAETPIGLLSSETFEKLMQTVAVSEEDFDRLFDELTMPDAWQVWEEYLEFARIIPFIEAAIASLQARQTTLEQVRHQGTIDRLNMLKKLGLVHENYSLQDMVREQAEQQAGQEQPSTPQEPSESGSTNRKEKRAKTKSKTR